MASAEKGRAEALQIARFLGWNARRKCKSRKQSSFPHLRAEGRDPSPCYNCAFEPRSTELLKICWQIAALELGEIFTY